MTKNLVLLLTLLASFALFQTACESDPCKDKDCANGFCDDNGDCQCDAGYEYDANGSCATLIVDKFVGNYVANENCVNSGMPAPYNVSVVADQNVGVKISGFYGPIANGGFVAPVVATLVGSDSISIARQQPDNDNIYVIGGGKITSTSPKTILINFTVTDEENPLAIITNTCSVTFK